MNWNDASTTSGLFGVTRLLNTGLLVASGVSVYALAFVLGDILSTCCNNNNVMWHVWFFESCLSLFSYLKAHLIIALTDNLTFVVFSCSFSDMPKLLQWSKIICSRQRSSPVVLVCFILFYLECASAFIHVYEASLQTWVVSNITVTCIGVVR